MRFISVIAAVSAAIGVTFDFGLARSAEPAPNWIWVNAPEAGFSASFPGQPKVDRGTHIDGSNSYKYTRYTVVVESTAMAVDYSVYDNPAVRIDLEKVMNGFADATKGKVTAQWQMNFKRNFGEPLPMLEYTVQSGDMMCRAGAIADGPAVYQVIGCANKSTTMPTAIEQMLKSFTLTPRIQS
jgi:hypothetical protein